ncbi:MAG: hypothetical protein ACREML_13720, partial [Vulcanimicrobiaceae bacterium]
AQINHWSAQDVEKARHDNATEAIQIRNGNLRYDAAVAGVGARYAAIDAANKRDSLNRKERVRESNQRETGATQRANLNAAGTAARSLTGTAPTYQLQGGKVIQVPSPGAVPVAPPLAVRPQPTLAPLPITNLPNGKVITAPPISAQSPLPPKMRADIARIKSKGYALTDPQAQQTLIKMGYTPVQIKAAIAAGI